LTKGIGEAVLSILAALEGFEVAQDLVADLAEIASASSLRALRRRAVAREADRRRRVVLTT
jgi:hydrogenase maturation factor